MLAERVLERKRVRFDFSPAKRSQSAAPATNRGGVSAPSNARVWAPSNARVSAPSRGPALAKSILSNSHTFPVTDDWPMDFSFQDFAARSHSISVPAPAKDERVQVRRMSLKEFTGLEGCHMPKPKVGAILEHKPLRKESKTASASLIDTFSTRRRSVLPSDDVTSESHDTDVLQNHLSDVHIDDMNFPQVKDRLEGMRSRLDGTMNGLPNQSPKKKINAEGEKVELLNEGRRLAGACKAMVRAVSGEEERQWATIVHEVVECADRVTSTTERIIQRSNSVFQAQLMTAKTDQMLKSLLETLASVEAAKEADPSSEAAKTLIGRSTTLAATITQLIQAVRSM